MNTTVAPETTPATSPVATSPERTLGILSLVLGAGAILAGMQPVLAIAGLVLGILALRREPAARGLAIAGIVTSSVTFAGIALAASAFLVTLPIFGLLGFAGWLF